jgi:hypothetical protein
MYTEYDSFDIDDEQHAIHLQLVLEQFRWSQLDHLHLDLGSFLGLHAVNPGGLGANMSLRSFRSRTLGPSHTVESRHIEGRMIINGGRKFWNRVVFK